MADKIEKIDGKLVMTSGAMTYTATIEQLETNKKYHERELARFNEMINIFNK